MKRYRVETIEERTVIFKPRFYEANSPEEAELKAINDLPNEADIHYVQIDGVHNHVSPA